MTAFDRAADVLGEAEFEAACMLKAGEVLYHVAGVDLAERVCRSAMSARRCLSRWLTRRP